MSLKSLFAAVFVAAVIFIWGLYRNAFGHSAVRTCAHFRHFFSIRGLIASFT